MDQCQMDAALNVKLRALFDVAHIITQHRFGPYTRDDRVVRERAFASYTMVMLNTRYDNPTCSPVDDGSTDSQSIKANAWYIIRLCGQRDAAGAAPEGRGRASPPSGPI